MITKETARTVWVCYDALDRCDKLMLDMKAEFEKTGDERLIDSFGNKKGLQLGVPCGRDAHKIFNVRIDLGIEMIEAHIQDQQAQLIKLGAIVKLEMSNSK